MTPRSILIIRPSAMGDIVMASPMLAVLRRAYPEAKLVWLVEPPHADLLRHHPDLDGLILWPKGRWRKLLRGGQWLTLLRELLGLRRELRSARFDLALDAVGLLKSRALARFSGAKERIGFASKEPGRFWMHRLIPRRVGDVRMSSEYAELMQALGFDPGPFPPRLSVGEKEAAAADQLLTQRGISGRYIVFAPCTTRPQKHWFNSCWSELAHLLASRYNLPILLLGGPGDVATCAAIAGDAPKQVHDLAGKSSLGETMALVRGASLLVGVDTGLTHMGSAFSLPTVALFGSTRPYLETANPQTRVLYDAMDCSPCRRRPICDGAFTCMRQLTPERVLEAAGELLPQEAP